MKNRIVNYANPALSVEILNRLFAMLSCSLARYLSYARPWVRRPYLLLDAVARRLSHEHEASAGRVAQLIAARRGSVESCVFPMDFTHYNDLSLGYLAPILLEHQRSLIDSAKQCAKELAHDPEANRVVMDLAASLRQYEAVLDELLTPHRLSVPLRELDRDTSQQHEEALCTVRTRVCPDAAEPQTAA